MSDVYLNILGKDITLPHDRAIVIQKQHKLFGNIALPSTAKVAVCFYSSTL